MSKAAVLAIALRTLTEFASGTASAYMPPGCKIAFELSDARPFVDSHLAPSQLTAAEAARFRHLPANGKQRKVLLLVRRYLRLCEQVIDGKMKPRDVCADAVEWGEAVDALYLTPPERAIFQRATDRSRRVAGTGSICRCEEELIHAGDAPPPAQPKKPMASCPTETSCQR